MSEDALRPAPPRSPRSALVSSVWTAGATLILASGVMQALWAAHLARGGSPSAAGGYTSFLSAVWGDAACLPVLVGSLVYLNKRYPRAAHERSLGIVSFLAGAALGALPQIISLLDPNPLLNWTFPRPHEFNAAGIYHMILAIGGAGLVTMLLATMLVRSWHHGYPGIDRKTALGALLASASAFLLLAGLDSSRSARDQLSVWIPLVLAWALVCLVAASPIFRSRPRKDA